MLYNEKAPSQKVQYARLAALGRSLSAADVRNPEARKRVSAKRTSDLMNAYRSSIGGGQGKNSPKKKGVSSSKVTINPTSYGFTEHKGTWGTSKK